MNRRRPREQSFLHVAVVAAAGGLLALGCAVFRPLYGLVHHRPVAPEFFYFAAWGFVALCGAVGCIHTYLISGDRPEKAPKGGVPVRELHVLEGGKARPASNDMNRRAA